MKDYNRNKIERLKSELEQYGFVFTQSVNWHINDLTAQAEMIPIDLSEKTDEELRGIMVDILDNNQDHLIEQINDALYDGLVKMFKNEEADDDSE